MEKVRFREVKRLAQVTQQFPIRAGMGARSCVLVYQALLPLMQLGFPRFCRMNYSLRLALLPLAISELGGARENRVSLFYLKGK